MPQNSSAGVVLDRPLVLCILASVPRPQAICVKKRVLHWVISLIAASGHGTGRGGEVPSRGQLHNVLVLSTRVEEGSTKEMKKLHSCPSGHSDQAGRQADNFDRGMHLAPLKHARCSHAVALPLATVHWEREGGNQDGFLELVVELPSDHEALRQSFVSPRPAASASPGGLKMHIRGPTPMQQSAL